jgi:hypothetical protein
MIKLVISLVFLCSCGKFPDCDNADYTTPWNICVNTAGDERFSEPEITYSIDKFFESFEYFTDLTVADEMRKYYKDTEMSLSFVSKEIPSSYGNWAEGGDFTYGHYVGITGIHHINSINLVIDDKTKDVLSLGLAHELLHSIQYKKGWLKEKSPHSSPSKWFYDYDLTTGERYAGQEGPVLESLISYYMFCEVPNDYYKYNKLCQANVLKKEEWQNGR